ncbi:hypothetical protein BKA69DRAFT_3585 [Paraphysoderma sedebokerense]|nr:hypothetical protein BKA69DRAFT_3585 [Paraphysoderma sedebokerense]
MLCFNNSFPMHDRLIAMYITFLVLLLTQFVLVAFSARPWFLHSSALSGAIGNPTHTVLHSTGNSTHFYLLDQGFRIHYFRLVSGSVVYDKTVNNPDGAGISGDNWRDTRTSVDVKLGLNPYNNELYMVKYGYFDTAFRLNLYRYSSANAQYYLYVAYWRDYPTFSAEYTHARVKMAFDSTYFYAAYYNDPNRSTKAGYFIARMLHSLDIYTWKTIYSATNRVLSIDFNCHK